MRVTEGIPCVLLKTRIFVYSWLSGLFQIDRYPASEETQEARISEDGKYVGDITGGYDFPRGFIVYDIYHATK